MPNFVIPFKSPMEKDLVGKFIPNSQKTIMLTEDYSSKPTGLKNSANSMDEVTGNENLMEADITTQNYMEALEPEEGACQPKESTIPKQKKEKKEKVNPKKIMRSIIKAEKNKKKSPNEKKKTSNKKEVNVSGVEISKRVKKTKPNTPLKAKMIASKEINDDIIDSVTLNINSNHNLMRDSLTSSQHSVYSEAFKKVALSQPGRKMSQKKKLLWLQKRREVGIWVECCNDDCKKWRFLANVFDPLEIPEKWYCQMNPDTSASNCNLKEWALKVEEEEDLIHATYSAGSLVWAHVQGYPWWPAIIDDCPDTEQFYWLNGFSDIPTFYNVTFFDEKVSRSWIETDKIYPYIRSGVKTSSKSLSMPIGLRRRLSIATKQADDAMLLRQAQRLKKYSFIARYKGAINYPLSKKFLKLFTRNQLESDSETTDIQTSDSDNDFQPETKKQKITQDVTNKRQQEVQNGLDQNNESYSSMVIPISPLIKITKKNVKVTTPILNPIEPELDENDLNQNASKKADLKTSANCSVIDSIDIDGFLFTEDSIVPSTQTGLEEINFDNSPTYSRGSPDFDM